MLVSLMAVGAAAGYPVYVAPKTETASPSTPVDAVVALGGQVRSATYAQELVEEGVSRHLVVSGGWRVATIDQICATTSPTYDVTCIKPRPKTTRGEARDIEQLATEHGWKHIVVVAPVYHVSRARMIVGRCYTGQTDFVPPPDLKTSPGEWAYQYAYQTAGFAKAEVLRGC